MGKLCITCGREFEPKTRLVREERYGKDVREYEIEDEECPDCRADKEDY